MPASKKKKVKTRVTRASEKKTKTSRAKKVKRPSFVRSSTLKKATTSRPDSKPIDSSSGKSQMKKALLEGVIFDEKEKKRIARDMLERYTGHEFAQFEKQIILTNFHYYIERFNMLLEDTHYTKGSAFQASSSKRAGVTIVEFGIGSAMAALVMELIASTNPKAVLFLGMCGGIHHSLKVGDFVLPIAAIRAESVSAHFMPAQVPALPTFKVQKFVSQVLVEHGLEYRTGSIHSTDLRFWEFDERFKRNLYDERVIAVEMETAALFITGFFNKVSIGALLLVSDVPLKRGGIKTKKSAKGVFKKYTDLHIELGIEIMADIAERGESIRYYTW